LGIALAKGFYLSSIARQLPPYAYDASFEISVNGEAIQLTARQYCVPGWSDGYPYGQPQLYWNNDFSVGSPLRSGGAVFVVVPDICQMDQVNPINVEWQDVVAQGATDLAHERIIMYLADDYETPSSFMFLPRGTAPTTGEPILEIVQAQWRATLAEPDSERPVIDIFGADRTALSTQLNGIHFAAVSPDIRERSQQIWETSDGRFQVYSVQGFSRDLNQYIFEWQYKVGRSALPAPIMVKRSYDGISILNSLTSQLQYGYSALENIKGLEVLGEVFRPDSDTNISQMQLGIYDSATGNMYFETHSNFPIISHNVRITPMLPRAEN